MKMILASASPRRQEILHWLNIPFRIIPCPLPEPAAEQGTLPEEHCGMSSLFKAREVARLHPSHFVLGVDTIVTLDNMILGKPREELDSRDMLRQLSGREHTVISALSLILPDNAIKQTLAKTTVRFRNLIAREIDWYVESGEGFDKAGGYGIQGRGRVLIHSINGCYYNVVGLPVAKLIDLLSQHAPQFWPPKKQF